MQVFGVDQSPWVQGVLFALSFNKISFNLTTKPPFFLWPLKYGLVIPVVSCNGKQLVDSFKIYKEMGLNDASSPRESIYVQKKLEKLFLYSLGRCGNRKT